MDKEIINKELVDKKSYAGIPEAEFVVRFHFSKITCYFHIQSKNILGNLIFPSDLFYCRKM